MVKPSDLLDYVFSGQKNALSRSMLGWMDASPRFTVFVDNYRDKIRKKARTMRGESSLDLLSELEAAYRLLNDRRLEIAYEPYASEKRRGPDFAVTYRSNLLIHVEVTRLRPPASESGVGQPARIEERLLRVLFSKLGQMQPNAANFLVVRTHQNAAQSVDLSGLMQGLKTLAEAREPAFYAVTGYNDPAAFFGDYLRLSGIVLWAAEPVLWINKQARPLLDEKAARLIAMLLSGAPAS